MSDDAAWNALSVIPTLQVPDLDAAIAYYTDLGFQELWRYPTPADGAPTETDVSPTHAGLALGHVTIMLATTEQELQHIERQNIYVIMENVRRYHTNLRGRLGDTVPELIRSDYGMLDFTLTDPWGHLLTFGEEC